MESLSVMKILPSGPDPNPIIAQFFNISQPMAPEPTKNTFKLAIFSWNALPKTAICPSYLDPIGLLFSSFLGYSVSEGNDSKESKYNHCLIGVNLEEQFFKTSWAINPP